MTADSLRASNDPQLDSLLANMDPLARVLFDHVVRMNHASQQYVFQRLLARFSRITPRVEREMLASHAIATAMADLGLADDARLTSEAYKSWYADLFEEAKGQFPSHSMIMGIFHNNWNYAVDSVVATPNARFLAVCKSSSKSFTNEEIRNALRLFAQENPDFTSFRREWKPWARKKNEQGVRVPISFHTVRQRFMTYEEMAQAAGVSMNPNMAARAMSDDEIRRIVREAFSEVNGTLTWTKFVAWRKAKLELDGSRVIPKYDTIAIRIGGGDWGRACDNALQGDLPVT